MPTTPILALPYPLGSDPADVPTDMGELANRIEAVRGATNGLASLGADGKVPTAQLPTATVDIPQSIVDAKGDLIAASAPDTVARLPIGTNGQILTADSAQALGLKWAEFSYQAYTPVLTAPTPPSIGSGSVIGRYNQIGKFVHCYGYIGFGTATSPGSGTYNISLPIPGLFSALQYSRLGMMALYGGGPMAMAMANITPDGMGMTGIYPASWPSGTLTFITEGTPWTWAAGHDIRWNITYEAA